MDNGKHIIRFRSKSETGNRMRGMSALCFIEEEAHKQAAGGILTGFLAVACGWMGEKHHIGFTVASRFSWGMRGSYCWYIKCDWDTVY